MWQILRKNKHMSIHVGLHILLVSTIMILLLINWISPLTFFHSNSCLVEVDNTFTQVCTDSLGTPQTCYGVELDITGYFRDGTPHVSSTRVICSIPIDDCIAYYSNKTFPCTWDRNKFTIDRVNVNNMFLTGGGLVSILVLLLTFIGRFRIVQLCDARTF